MATKRQVIDEFAVTAAQMYLDYFNNFLSVGAFADYYFITDVQARAVINVGREQYNNNADANMKPRRRRRK